MKTCYAICEADVEFDDVLKEKIKHELRQTIHKDNISVIINGFGDNADVLNSIINGIDSFTGEVYEKRLYMWETYKFDILFFIDASQGSRQWINAALSTFKKIIAVYI